MLTSKALILGTTLFAIFSFYGIFHSLYQTQLKFEDTSKTNLLSHNDNKWFKHKTRVVMVIIDAFRFDYLLNYKSLDKDPAMKNHKLQRFNHEFFKHPEKFVVVRALADLPTMTVLRVPCLMTGNVPRLGSVLTAFGALPAEEDSVPRQLHLQKKKSYFSGDPILKEYFPEYLESDYKIGSFNIDDWTVDQPVQAYTNKKLAENKFDFLVAHLLRLDHAGHSGGVAGHQSLNALKDIDRFLVNLIENIDDDTMLIFGGDHGMVAPGSHGGGSKQETNTAIVAYHKKGFKKYHKKNHGLSKIMRSVNETNAQVHQIDLAPTLSMLMGLPTPFSNMGQILNDLYPNGHYFDHHPECPNTTAFEAGFDMQLLHDNKINTVQVWNYFRKYHEGQSLFSGEEFSEASDLYNEASKVYHEAEKLIKEHKVCTDSFHKATIKAIQKSQQLSNLIHDMVSNKPPHDLVIFWQSFALLLLVCVSYTLLIQYLYKTKDYERFTITWSHPSTWDWKGLAKRTAPLTITLALIWIYMWARDYRMMRPVTSTALVLAIWLLKFSVFSFISQPQEDVSFESIPSSPTNEADERRTHVFSLKKLFIFQNPLITAGALAIITLLFYLTHARHVQKNDIADLRQYNPYVFILLAGLRLSGRYLKFSPYIMAVAVLLCKGLSIEHYKWFWTSKGIITMGLILVADWIWSEIQFAWKKLKASKIWSFQYVICFLLLVEYHLHGDPKSEWIQITVPRLVWALLAISSIAGFALKMPRNVIKRNIQVNLVLYLTLMQLHRKLLFFGIVLSVYRITNFLFRRVQFKNYLYPLILGFISYFGLLSIGFGDRKLPRNFEPAFVGMHEFHLALCLLLYASAMLTTIIMGMLFISFYNQDLELQEVELGSPKEETSDAQVVALKGHSNIIRKRNVIFYGFFYCLLMLGAAINPVIMKNHKKIYLSMERFLVDGALFLFTINAVCFVF